MGFWALLLLAAAQLVLLLWLALRRAPVDAEGRARLQQLSDALQQQSQQSAQRLERMESELRREVGENARAGRQELQQTLTVFQDTLSRQLAEATRTQNTQLDAFAQQLLQLRGTLGDTLTQQLQAISLGMSQQAAEATRTQNAQIDAFAQQLLQLRGTLGDTLTQQLKALMESNERRLAEMRATLEAQIGQLQTSNAAKLDEMRATVDEKLHATLEARLGESFKQVAERLEQVHKGLGEMHSLAQGVGDLKHLLTNVKTRGMFGEAQLGALLEQVLSPEQYAMQVSTRPGCRSMPSSPTRTTSACSMPSKGPTQMAPNSPPARWSSAFALRPSPWPRSTWSPLTPPTSRSCSCRPKVSMPRCCVVQA